MALPIRATTPITGKQADKFVKSVADDSNKKKDKLKFKVKKTFYKIIEQRGNSNS
jgi:hypothetical protein